MRPLTPGEKHLLRLTEKGMADAVDGWAVVSHVVWPLMVDMPPDLVDTRSTGMLPTDGGVARLTDVGRAVLGYL